jgi:hypothetical protein
VEGGNIYIKLRNNGNYLGNYIPKVWRVNIHLICEAPGFQIQIVVRYSAGMHSSGRTGTTY